ncbi:MAG: ATP-grasp domain-containing protein [Bryobacteraceae bacterium]
MSAPKRLLLVASTTGYQTRVFAEEAARVGYELRLATDRCHVLEDPWGDRAIAVRFDDACGAAETIARECAGALDGIVAVGDRPAWLAALAAERLGLPYNSPGSVEAARNKYLSRERFRAAGLAVPGYRRVALDAAPRGAAADARYPCVLKPLGLSASRGVIRADDAAQFIAAFERIRTLLAAPEVMRLHDGADRYLQVEDFIPGREFALEGLLTDGRLRVLALFDKPDPLDGPFFEETIYTTPSRASAATQAAIVDTTQRAIEALGLTRGPVHAEMRINHAGVWMLEVAARPIGGLCAKTLRFAGAQRVRRAPPSEPGTASRRTPFCASALEDVSLEEVILRHAAGEQIGPLHPVSPASGVMMIPVPHDGVYRGVSGSSEAGAVTGMEEVVITAKPGQALLGLPEGASYLGFLFARGGNAPEVESALRAAHAQLKFEIATALPVRPPG